MPDDQIRPRPDGPHQTERQFQLPQMVRELPPRSPQRPAYPESAEADADPGADADPDPGADADPGAEADPDSGADPNPGADATHRGRDGGR